MSVSIRSPDIISKFTWNPPGQTVNYVQKALIITLGTSILLLHYINQHAGFWPGKTTWSLLQSGKGRPSLSYLFTDLAHICATMTNSTNVFYFLSGFPKPVLWHTTSGLWAKTKGLMMTLSSVFYHVWLKIIKYDIFSTDWFFGDIDLWHTTSWMFYLNDEFCKGNFWIHQVVFI